IRQCACENLPWSLVMGAANVWVFAVRCRTGRLGSTMRRTVPGHDLAATTFVDVLAHAATRHPDRPAFTYLASGEGNEVVLTYGTLHRQAGQVADRLRTLAAPGERALLVYPPGLDFASAFFGCLNAGVVAVPVSPPRPNRPPTGLRTVIAEAGPRV